MANQNQSIRSSEQLISRLPLLVVLFLLGWFICILTFWVRYGSLFVYNAEVVEFGVCLTNTTYKPVEQVPISSSRFFLCGRTIGTTILPGALMITHAGRTIFSTSGNYGPGHFFQEVRVSDKFLPGEYKADFGYNRQVVASALFTITSD